MNKLALRNQKMLWRGIIGLAAIIVLLIAMNMSAAQASEQTEVLWTNNNPNSVHNETKDYYVMLDIDRECIVTSIMTYHYFNDGALPGTITLFSEGGEQWGPFQAEGVDGQGDVKNAYWVADAGEIRLSPGRYAIADSDQSTWSSNKASDYYGIAELRGYYPAPINPFGTTEKSTEISTEAAKSNAANDISGRELGVLEKPSGFSFRNGIVFGMTPDEVIGCEQGHSYTDYMDNDLMYWDLETPVGNADVHYVFDDLGILESIVVLQAYESTNYDEDFALFNNTDTALTAVFGEPNVRERYFRTAEGVSLNVMSYWELDDVYINHSAQGGDSALSEQHILYEIPDYD